MTDRPKAAWRRHRRKYLLFLAVLVAAPTGAFMAARGTDETEGARPTLAQLAAKNYRTLSVSESRRLLTYARKEYACLASLGAPVSPPAVSRTRITMTAPNRPPKELVRFMTNCDPNVGPPPAGASLQARPGQVLIYLPKRCLLNPSTATSTAS